MSYWSGTGEWWAQTRNLRDSKVPLWEPHWSRTLLTSACQPP